MKPGTYNARCIGAVLTAPPVGRERVHLKFALSENDAEIVTWEGFFGDVVDSGNKTLSERTFDSLRACGWEGDDVSQLETCKKNDVEIVVISEEYNGRSRLKVRFVQPLGTAAKFAAKFAATLPDPLPPARAAAFAERMKLRAQGIRSNAIESDHQDPIPF